MTLPDERIAAVLRTREFLIDLIDRSKTKRIPLEIRKRAGALLKHYSGEIHLNEFRPI